MLGHFLAALAYRNQKALRDSSDGFGAFSIDVRGVSTSLQSYAPCQPTNFRIHDVVKLRTDF